MATARRYLNALAIRAKIGRALAAQKTGVQVRGRASQADVVYDHRHV